MLGNTGSLAGRTLFITGASRGIGKAIALKAAKDGANIVVAAKTAEAHPKLPGTIFTAAKEIEAAGGQALPCIVDVRDEESVVASVEKAVAQFGGIDILINNASAISLTGTQQTPMKKYDLMNQVNARGTYLVSRSCVPYLLKSKNPHILNISPPLNMRPRWFKDHVAYTMAKYGMSMCVLGMSEEFKEDGIAVNALWPRTAIMTAAMEMLGGKDIGPQCRVPEIMADSAYAILSKDSKSYTGNFAIDDEVLSEAGVTNFDGYAVDPKAELMPDFFLDALDEVLARNALQNDPPKPAAEKAAEAAGDESAKIEKVFDVIKDHISEEILEKTQCVYSFSVALQSGETEVWYLDLKNAGVGSGRGDPSAPADVTFSMKVADFHAMFAGKLKPTTAFMSGRMRMKGDLTKAMKLESMMGKLISKL